MRKKSGSTIAEQAITLVPEFGKAVLNLNNRLPCVARVRVHFRTTTGALMVFPAIVTDR